MLNLIYVNVKRGWNRQIPTLKIIMVMVKKKLLQACLEAPELKGYFDCNLNIYINKSNKKGGEYETIRD